MEVQQIIYVVNRYGNICYILALQIIAKFRDQGRHGGESQRFEICVLERSFSIISNKTFWIGSQIYSRI